MRAPRAGSIEEKVERLNELQARASREQKERYISALDMSWVHHDNALEGIVYAPQELTAALQDNLPRDSPLLPPYDEIRQFKSAIDLVRRLAEDENEEITLDTIKQIYAVLDPEDVESNGPARYRKDMPLHRLYFHEISQPDKISPRMRQLIQWIQSPDTRRLAHPVRVASRAHHTLLRIFPFAKHSGRVGRLLMNLMLLREKYPPAVVHSTDRQRYYDALKASPDAVASLVHEALTNSVDSAIHFLEGPSQSD